MSHFVILLLELVPLTRIERVTSPLPRECSATELQGLNFHSTRLLQSGKAGETTFSRSGAGEGNRTLVVSLEGFCSTIELHPHTPVPATLPTRKKSWWRRLDSNQRRRKPTDLQSAPFSHSGTPPRNSQLSGFSSLKSIILLQRQIKGKLSEKQGFNSTRVVT